MMNTTTSSAAMTLPFKSVAIALLFCAILGPVGLLYSSLRGGVFMILVGIVVISSKFLFPILLVWLICCVWGVKAVESHNQTLIRMNTQQ